MAYKTKSGYILTDEMIEQLGEACEGGEYPGAPGSFLVAPVGRPKLHPNEDLVTVAFKVPRSKKDLLDAKVAKQKTTRSKFMRDALDEALLHS